MDIQVIVLNGGSSSGKSGIVRCLQAILPEPWLTFGVDTFVAALPGGVITLADDGEVGVGPEFRRLEDTWITGVTAMVRAGAKVIIDEVFLGGAASQQRWQRHLDGVNALWVGVRCAPAIAAEREMARGDRVTGMAASQAEVVHRGVTYDLEVDTANTESMTCARTIAARVT